MNNTYGLHSINQNTFNVASTSFSAPVSYSQVDRNRLIIFFRIHNLILDILGYLPGVSNTSGCVRMGTGCLMLTATLVKGRNKKTIGLLSGQRYEEAIFTAITQIFRGAMEALMPFGKIVNLCIGIWVTVTTGLDSFSKEEKGYPEPGYPRLLSVLYLA